MAKTFAITTAKQTCALDSGRNGGASFTVTNTTGQPHRGLLKIKALGATDAAWITLQGDAEREFTANGTQQVSAKIAVPASVAPGKYNFRLDTISVADPDEDYTEGQSVAIEVQAAAAVPPKKFPWWIVIVIIAVLAIVGGFVTWLVTSGSKVTVTSVVGKQFSAAKKELEDLGLNVAEPKKKTDNAKPVDEVLDQDPKASTEVEKGATVELTVAAHVALPPPPPPVVNLPYGPDTCVQGFVWREAFAGDHVCVTPETRAQTARDNSQAAARREPKGGAYGPDTCRAGFVWRDARPGDHVCVTPAARTQAAHDNSQAAVHRVRH